MHGHIVGQGKVLRGSLFSLFVMMWKFTVIDMVKVDTDRYKFQPENVWRSALRRLDAKIDSYARKAKRKQIRAIGLRRNAPPRHAFNPALAPLAEIDSDFDLTRNPAYDKALRALTD